MLVEEKIEGVSARNIKSSDSRCGKLLRKANSIPRPIDRGLEHIRGNHYGIVGKSGEAIPAELRQIKERLVNTNGKGIEEGNEDNKQPYGLDLSGDVRKLGLHLLREKKSRIKGCPSEGAHVVFWGWRSCPRDPETAAQKPGG